MPMPRIAHQVQWSNEDARKSDGMWGCWECGNEDSRVRDVDKDAEHIRVRLRQCTRCGAMWETEEHRIGRGSFFGRAERRRYAAFRKSRYRVRRCLMCNEKFLQGTYREHTQTSMPHIAARSRRDERIRERERAYKRRWQAAKREVLRSQREAA